MCVALTMPGASLWRTGCERRRRNGAPAFRCGRLPGKTFLTRKLATLDMNPFAHSRTKDEWLELAESQFREAKPALEQRDQRSLLACLKASAGFALEAWLLAHPQPWGASPLVRLASFARADGVPPEVQRSAAMLVSARICDPDLVQIGRPTTGPLAWSDSCRAIVDYCRQVTAGNG